MKLIVLAVLTLAVSASYRQFTDAEAFQMWNEFKGTHNKAYTAEQEAYRFNVFKDNLEVIATLQMQDPEAVYGTTEFSDLTSAEFEQMFLGLAQQEQSAESTYFGTNGNAPDAFDWTDKQAVSEVKNQGQCGSCWSFSTTGNLESQNFIKNGKMVTLSEQQLVDCDKNDQGCNGGLMDNAFKWLQANGGIMTEDDYPYKGVDGSCQFDKSKAVVQVTGFQDIDSNEDTMKDALYNMGPLSIGINANFMQFYIKGVANPLMCNPKGLNHGVLIVGYGNDKKDFWKIKNSWGGSWGEKGYCRIVRGSNKCGLANAVSCATVA